MTRSAMVPMPGGGTLPGTDGGSLPLSPTKKNGGDIPETAIEFLQTLRIPEGPLAGKPLVLAEFQKRFIRGAMADGIMVGVLSIGRGNAKTATAGGIGLGALMGIWDAQPKREIIIAARNRDQAKTAFQFVAGFVEGLPEAEQELFTVRRGYKLEIEYSANGGGCCGLFRLMASRSWAALRHWRSWTSGRLGNATRAMLWKTRSCLALENATGGR